MAAALVFSTETMKKYLILLASGTGSRFGASCPKQFIEICGKMVIEYTLEASDCGLFDEILLVVSAPYIEEMARLCKRNAYKTPIRVVEGGASRKESCECGVAAIPESEGFVVIHNGVQPFITKNDYEKSLAALENYPAVTSGAPCVYTVLETDGNGVLKRMAPRSLCYGDLGPECFHLSLIRKVFEIGKTDNEFTNLTGMVMKHGLGDIFVVEGSPKNIKITYPEDVIFAERIINGK